MSCPNCGKEASGRFCSWCGGTLAGVFCSGCGAEGEPGGRFCNDCGAPLGATANAGAGAGASGNSSKIVWGAAGLLMVAIILAVGLPAVRGNGADAGATPGTAAPQASPPGTGAAPDISNMSPRERADALYERVMMASSREDSATVVFFLPMATQAYELARPLDADGYFHLSLLQRMSGDPARGLATAEEALGVHPNHLLVLAAGGGAAAEVGDDDRARDLYARMLEQWDAELAKGLEEYDLHSGMMPELRADAEEVLGG